MLAATSSRSDTGRDVSSRVACAMVSPESIGRISAQVHASQITAAAIHPTVGATDGLTAAMVATVARMPAATASATRVDATVPRAHSLTDTTVLHGPDDLRAGAAGRGPRRA